MVELRRMVEGDVEEVIRCFENCYGRTYIADFYDPEWMREQIRSGARRSVVAVDSEAGIVGHMALKVVHEGALACEAGSTVVEPDFRNQGLMSRMGRMITALCISEGFVGNVNEPTTAHDIMQKGAVARGGVETGIMLELIPAETDFRLFETHGGRTATTVVYQPLAEAPARSLFVPEVYRELLAGMYREAGLERQLEVPEEPELPERSTTTRSLIERGSLARIWVERVGADFESVMAGFERPTAVSQVDLLLDDPGVEVAAKVLRSMGFFFCALMPEFASTDLLRLQRLENPGPHAFEPRLVNAGAKSLVALMRLESGRV